VYRVHGLRLQKAGREKISCRENQGESGRNAQNQETGFEAIVSLKQEVWEQIFYRKRTRFLKQKIKCTRFKNEKCTWYKKQKVKNGTPGKKIKLVQKNSGGSFYASSSWLVRDHATALTGLECWLADRNTGSGEKKVERFYLFLS